MPANNPKSRDVPNQRAAPRVAAFIPVTVHFDDGSSVKGEIEDISLGGAFIRCPRPLKKGQRIKLEIHFSALKSNFNGSIVEVDEIADNGVINTTEPAEVRWDKNGHSFGIKFVSLSWSTRRFVGRLVKYFEKMKAEIASLE